jgi:Deacetylases, including yeast histone deacetylase and acetoin utilization protein
MSTPVASDDDSFTDGDYDPYSDVGPRYPVHEACEFQSAEVLRGMIFVPRNRNAGDTSDSSDNDNNSDDDNDHPHKDDASEAGSTASDESSDTDEESDSAAAAMAATGQNISNSGTAANGPLNAVTETVAASPGSIAVGPDQTGTTLDASAVDVETSSNSLTQTPRDDSAMDVEPASANVSGEDELKSSEQANTATENLDDISPLKLDKNGQVTGELPDNATKRLASDFLDHLSKPQSNDTTETSRDGSNPKESTGKQKRKKRKKTKVPIVSYYCPHDLDQRDPQGNTPLHVAIHCRKLEHMKLLLEAGAQPNMKCDNSAPIHTAVSIGSITAHKQFAYEAVELLSKYGADLAARDDSSHTPLYLATMYNIPSVAGLLLNDPIGLQTLNVRSDRKGGRPLHAAARFNVSRGKILSQSAGNGKINQDSGASSKTIITQMLLNTPGIEVDVTDNYGHSPLHVASSRGNWQVVRLLLAAGANAQLKDQRGLTAGLLALKKGMAIPNDVNAALGLSTIPPSIDSICMPPKRDLIIDPEGSTFLICHELCSQHLTCPPIRRNNSDTADPPPENVHRLSVLLDEQTGILRSAEFDNVKWEGDCRRASIADVLKVHEFKYVEHISQLCSEIPDHPSAIAHLDSDTGISRWSFEAAMRAAGSVCEAVDRVMAGDFRNAFCAIRPPGHHAGPRGVVKCEKDPEGSHGFCLLNNVAIGAAYARSMYRNDGIKKVAIIDFDVHHGNGTEAVIRNLVPTMDKATIRLPFALGSIEVPRYRPWLDETDIENVFFASAHGYGPRQLVHHMGPHPGWFYPSSGRSFTSPSVVSSVETPSIEEFIMTQSWIRLGEEARMHCTKVINIGLSLPVPGEIPGMQRVETRDAYRKNILPHLLEFNPDIIFISAGFDAHKRDEMNFGYVGMVEEDYEWLTEQLVKVANTCCNGRIISVLEGGYRIHGGIVSPFARSVASHVRGLMEGGNSRELYDCAESEWESRFEREMIEERERKRQLRMERLIRPYGSLSKRLHHATDPPPAPSTVEPSAVLAPTDMDELMQLPLVQNVNNDGNVAIPLGVGAKDDEDDSRPSKRKRNQVDYKELYELMKKEGLA